MYDKHKRILQLSVGVAITVPIELLINLIGPFQHWQIFELPHLHADRSHGINATWSKLIASDRISVIYRSANKAHSTATYYVYCANPISVSVLLSNWCTVPCVSTVRNYWKLLCMSSCHIAGNIHCTCEYFAWARFMSLRTAGMSVTVRCNEISVERDYIFWRQSHQSLETFVLQQYVKNNWQFKNSRVCSRRLVVKSIPKSSYVALNNLASCCQPSSTST